LPIRVLVVDDHALVREGLVRLLEQTPTLLAVGYAASGPEAIAIAPDLQPDVVLVELQLPQTDGIETTRRLLEVCPGTRVLILGGVESEDAVVRAIRAGASGYLLKTQPFGAVVHAIEVSLDGGLTLPRDLTVRALARERLALSEASEANPTSGLTRRERQVLHWLTTGESNRQIAARLVISEHTVRAHLRSLTHKLGVTNRARAAAVAAGYVLDQSEAVDGEMSRQ
jgi:DNA-binding NarL/FixJ family response regulator